MTSGRVLERGRAPTQRHPQKPSQQVQLAMGSAKPRASIIRAIASLFLIEFEIGAPWGACPKALRPSPRLSIRRPGRDYH